MDSERIRLVDKQLLEMLQCPLTGAPLVVEGNWLVSTCPETRKAYPVEDGFPVLLIDEAKQLAPEEHSGILLRHGAQPFQKKKKVKA